MNAHDCIQWRKRRTVGWLNLSLAARGAVEGIVVALDARGELRLGKPGLPGLAALLGRPWAECEPAVAELLEAERFVFDAVRGVLVDPQHVERQELGAELLEADVADVPDVRRTRPDMSGTSAKRPPRPLSTAPDAVRKRARRREKLAEQLELPSLADVAAASVPSLYDLRSSNEEQREAAAPSRPRPFGRIQLAAGDIPEPCVKLASANRPDLLPEVIVRSWRRFALRKSGRFTSMAVVEAEWEGWIEGEGRHVAPPPKSQRRPIVAAGPPPPPQTRPKLPSDPELVAVMNSTAVLSQRAAEAVPPAAAAVA